MSEPKDVYTMLEEARRCIAKGREPDIGRVRAILDELLGPATDPPEAPGPTKKKKKK